MVLSLCASARAGNQNDRIRSLVSSYKGTEGFEIVDIGGLGLGLMKAVVRANVDDEEDRQALELFKGLKRLTVVDFSDAAPRDRGRFLDKAGRILSRGEMLLETKDGDETVRIYGTSSEDGNILEDIAVLSGDALIFIRGTIRADQIGTLIEQADR